MKHAFQQQLLTKAVCVDLSVHKPEGFSSAAAPAETGNLTSCIAAVQGLEELFRLLCCSSLIHQVQFSGTSPGTGCPQPISHCAKEIWGIVLTQMKVTFSDYLPSFDFLINKGVNKSLDFDLSLCTFHFSLFPTSLHLHQLKCVSSVHCPASHSLAFLVLPMCKRDPVRTHSP